MVQTDCASIISLLRGGVATSIKCHQLVLLFLYHYLTSKLFIYRSLILVAILSNLEQQQHSEVQQQQQQQQLPIPTRTISTSSVPSNVAVSVQQLSSNNMSSSSTDNNTKPVVICGPSGVGKGTLINMLMKHWGDDKFGFSVSHTTRQPRDGEVDGTHYNFTTVEQIKQEIADHKLIEYAEVHGKYYGTR